MTYKMNAREELKAAIHRSEIMVENSGRAVANPPSRHTSGYLVSRNPDSGDLRWWAPEDMERFPPTEEDVRPAHPVEIAVAEAIIGWKDGDPPVGLGVAIKALMEVYQAAYFLRGLRW